MKKSFTMDKFTGCEITGTDKIAKYIVEEGYTTEDVDTRCGFIKIAVKEWDEEDDGGYVLLEGFKWLEDDIEYNTEIWVIWEEEEGELTEWWIAGDNT